MTESELYIFSYFYWIHGWIDRTKPRFHENTKLFTVEGNIGAGKVFFVEMTYVLM